LEDGGYGTQDVGLDLHFAATQRPKQCVWRELFAWPIHGHVYHHVADVLPRAGWLRGFSVSVSVPVSRSRLGLGPGPGPGPGLGPDRAAVAGTFPVELPAPCRSRF